MKRFLDDESALSATEYAVCLALIIVVCIASVMTLGNYSDSIFTTVGNKIGSASS